MTPARALTWSFVHALALAALLAVPTGFLATGAQAEGDSASAALTSDPKQVRAGRYVLDPAHGKITWSLSHLGFSTYYGQISDVASELTLDPEHPDKSAISVTIGIASVSGLNPKLDAHIRQPEFFDTERFPQATYVSKSIEPTSPTTARVQGDLTIKGITRTVAFDATFNQAGTNPVDKKYSVGFDGRAVIRRSDFGISAFLPAVGDEVALRIEGEFKAANQQ